jgi:excinuclease UvrABC ATPase subunit
VAQGTPEQVSRVKKSYTGQALIEYFNGSRRNPVKNASTRNEAEKSVLAPTGTEAMA